jgi:hypothetical protein
VQGVGGLCAGENSGRGGCRVWFCGFLAGTHFG